MSHKHYIKFTCKWDKKALNVPTSTMEELINCRNKLYQMNLIGAFENGIGFGNISMRLKEENVFLITGSATGNEESISGNHLSLVTNYSIEMNTLWCQGMVKASSESLSHAALYETNQEIEAVIHTHHKAFWETNKEVLPTTNPQAEFGTSEMAKSIQEMAKKTGQKSNGIFIMGGHPEGILSFGKSLSEAMHVLVEKIKT